MNKELLAFVSRPSRYLGNEVNSFHKDIDKVRLKFALAFPDAYEVGMSHIGLQILYSILNSRDDIVCERVFAPWIDMEAILRSKGMPLVSLESGFPLRNFDVIGFSLQYELSFSNVLNMLELSSIPLLADERDENYPIILAGGPCAFNPEPTAEFFDAILIGEGEEAILEIAEVFLRWKEARGDKGALLKELSRVPGVYIPSFFKVRYNRDNTIAEMRPLSKGVGRVKKRLIHDLDTIPYPTRPILPFMKIIHDRLTAEIARGCKRGCRFCQAGFIYRPYRERSIDQVEGIIHNGLATTGYEEISLLSLSAGDYSCIRELMAIVMGQYAGEKVAISLPSMRIETLTQEMMDQILRVRKTGFTMAPEAGTPRLREVINKGIEEDGLFEATRHLSQRGWRSVKLYFMIGLPTEREEDLRAVVDLSGRLRFMGGRSRASIHVNTSISTFVPKAHTPFQWEPQVPLGDILNRHTYLRSKLQGQGVRLKWQDPRMSLLEGVFARGDRRLSRVLMEAHSLGCRFDGWGEHFRFDLWKRAFDSCGLSMEFYANRRRAFSEVLPWDHIDSGIEKEFLLRDCEKSMRGETSPQCSGDSCEACGVCDRNETRLQIKRGISSRPTTRQGRRVISQMRIRARVFKLGEARFLSHLEMVTAFHRAVKRAHLPLSYSRGFHPLPKIRFEGALPLGVESLAELADFELFKPIRTETFMEKLNRELPEGLGVSSLEIIFPSRRRGSTKEAHWCVVGFSHLKGFQEKIDAFVRRDRLVHAQRRKRGIGEIDLRSMVQEVRIRDTIPLPEMDTNLLPPSFRELLNWKGGVIEFIVKGKDGQRPRAREVVSRVFGLTGEQIKGLQFIKLAET
ncbi:MAG: TIGR03960 family B12-binding radical SAM protein [Syntrophobacterales bacterium]|nr:MAG: TIGR03960 family B12-binding radical SAM protein [Syntrophobacterales bacterium]